MAIHLGISNDGTFVSSDGYDIQDINGVSLFAMPASDKMKIVINNIVYRVNINLDTKDGE